MQIPYTVEERPDTGLYNAKLGVWLFLASEVMLFGALFSTYVLLRTGADSWPDGASILNVPLFAPFSAGSKRTSIDRDSSAASENAPGLGASAKSLAYPD